MLVLVLAAPAVAVQATPSISTTASSAALDAAIHDDATLSGGNNPSGTVSFKAYSTSDCSGAAAYSHQADVASSAASSGDFTPTSVGSYHWTAAYSGDSNNVATSSSCGDSSETSTVGVRPRNPTFGNNLYVSQQNDSKIVPFSIQSDGTLARIACTGTNCGTGTNPSAVAITPDGKFLYTVTEDSTIDPYAIGAGGALTPISCTGSNCDTGSQPFWLTISPNGKFLYVSEFGGSKIAPYAIASDGSLTPIDCPGTSCQTGNGPMESAITPDGKFLYVTNSGDNSVSPFAIADDGSLTPLACTGTNCDTGAYPWNVKVTPDGKYLYVLSYNGSSISPFAIGSDGSLTPVSCGGTKCKTGSGPTGLAVSPNGKLLYATSSSDGNVGPYAIESDGSLTPIACAGSNCDTSDGSSAVALSPDGKYLYATSYNDDVLHPFAVGSSGSLTPFGCSDTDCGGVYESQWGQSVVASPDQAPSASFTATPGAPGTATHFDGSASTAEDGHSVARYDWSFGDGTTAQDAGAKPTHTYSQSRSYTVTLTVTDDAGCSTALVFTGQTAYCNGGPSAHQEAQIAIKVAPTLPPKPTASITSPKDGRAFVEGAHPHAAYSCAEPGGPGIASCKGPVPNHGLIDTNKVGKHAFSVTATDTAGHNTTKTVHYNVLSRGTLTKTGQVRAFRRGGKLWIDAGILAGCPEKGPDCTGRLRSHYQDHPPFKAASVSTRHVGGGVIRVAGEKHTMLVFRLGKHRSAILEHGGTIHLWIDARLHRGTKRLAHLRRVASVSLSG
jgi:6-phosphogluconolactonase (cycloisomerase 2 family)